MAKIPCEYEEIINVKFAKVQKNYLDTYSAIAAGATATYNIDISQSGYTPIGLAGFGVYTSSPNSGACAVLRTSIGTSGTTGTIEIKNVTSVAATPYMVYLIVTYVSNS